MAKRIRKTPVKERFLAIRDCEEAPVIRCARCYLSHWDGVRFGGYGCLCLRASAIAGYRRAMLWKRFPEVKPSPELTARMAARDIPIGLRDRRQFVRCDRCLWSRLDMARNRMDCCPCCPDEKPEVKYQTRIPLLLRRPGSAKPQIVRKRRTELGGKYIPRPARVALIGQTFLAPKVDRPVSAPEVESVAVNRGRKTVTGGVSNPSRPFVIVRVSNKNSKAIRDFHHWCASKGLVTYPLEFAPEDVERVMDSEMQKSIRATMNPEALERGRKPGLIPHYWEVCGPYLALLGLRSHRSVKEWFAPKRGTMPSPMGQGQSAAQ